MSDSGNSSPAHDPAHEAELHELATGEMAAKIAKLEAEVEAVRRRLKETKADFRKARAELQQKDRLLEGIAEITLDSQA